MRALSLGCTAQPLRSEVFTSDSLRRPPPSSASAQSRAYVSEGSKFVCVKRKLYINKLWLIGHEGKDVNVLTFPRRLALSKVFPEFSQAADRPATVPAPAPPGAIFVVLSSLSCSPEVSFLSFLSLFGRIPSHTTHS